ncbi:TIR-like protein FxsC [Nonomuraea sp. NPDC050783]|uniref:TIR-like protein FxsC n=1 Tax=Nonomuraea sp. NPDC050783 TaxID=3154634 RepID=UPI003465C8EB
MASGGEGVDAGMSASGGIGQAPYFFLSYAHNPAGGLNGDRDDPNKSVYKFFGDLCRNLVEITNLRNYAEAGFIDRELRPGDRWPRQVSSALASCRVFVPLFCRRYFESEHCGKEWTAIQMRLAAHMSEPPPVIVPVEWYPVEMDRLPECVRDIQLRQEGLWPRQRSTGMLGLVKFANQSTYKRVVFTLAQRIAQIAESTPLQVLSDHPDYTALADSFADSRVPKRIKVAVVALHGDNLPEKRTGYYYGKTPREWDPYRSENDYRPVVWRVNEMVRGQGFTTEMSDLDALEGSESLHMVVADPWATARDDTRDELHRALRTGTRWFPVVVPWNHLDVQTSEAASDLRRSLEQTATSVRNVDSLDDLRDHMPKLVAVAAERYLQTAPVLSPPGPVIKRPRMMEPGDGERPG